MEHPPQNLAGPQVFVTGSLTASSQDGEVGEVEEVEEVEAYESLGSRTDFEAIDFKFGV